jgi:hypothetical protein
MPITLLLNCLFTGELRFTVMVQQVSGKFEVTESNAPVVSGLVRVPTNVSREMVALEPPKPIVNDDLLKLSSRDIYKYFRLCGYEYRGVFCGIVSADNHGGYHFMLYYMNSLSLSSLAMIYTVWDVDICSDNHVHYNKYLSSGEYNSWSGKLNMPEEHRRKLLL